MFKSGKLAFLLFVYSALLYSNCDCEEFYAEEDCTPCCSVCTCGGSFGAGGNWLYLRPLITPIEYARKTKIIFYSNLAGTLIKSKNLCFDTENDLGFEIFAYYRSALYCDDFKWDLKGNFLSHRTKDGQSNSSTAPSFFQPTIGFIPQASVNQFASVFEFIETDFERLNGEFGGVIDRVGSYFLRFFAGVQYANLKTNLTVDFTESFPPVTVFSANETEIVELSRFYGIGPRIGLDGRIPLFCGLSVIGEFGVNLLFSKKSGSLQQESFVGETGTSVPENDLRLSQSFCHSRLLTPGIDGKVGLDLRINFWDCFTFHIEGGYRGLYYWDAVTHLEIVSNRIFSEGESAFYTDSSTFEKSQHFGLTGWFVGGSLQF